MFLVDMICTPADHGPLASQNSDQTYGFLFRFLSGKKVQFHLSRKNQRKFHSNGKRSRRDRRRVVRRTIPLLQSPTPHPLPQPTLGHFPVNQFLLGPSSRCQTLPVGACWQAKLTVSPKLPYFHFVRRKIIFL